MKLRTLMSVIALSAATAGLLSMPSGVSALDAGCDSQGGNGLLNVQMRPGGRYAVDLFVTSGGEIKVLGNGPSITCGHVAETNTVAIGGTMGRDDAFHVPFHIGPGMTDEPGTSDEIELYFDGRGTLSLDAGPGPETVRFGRRQINLNADETSGVDSDAWVEAANIDMDGSNRDDLFDASGGRGTPTRLFELPIVGDAGRGSDTFVGGAAGDRYHGGVGDDRLLGLDGDDFVLGSEGNDRLMGNDGRDYLNGGDGRDVLIGGPGRDECRGDDQDVFRQCEEIAGVQDD